VGNNFCLVVELVGNLDRLTVQAEVTGLAEMTAEEQERLAKRVLSGVKATVGVSPKVELHGPFTLPRVTEGQGKSACHRVDDRRRG
jgi:phenylacetate-coenzyme A ligase PaaK-like adenylate-forming protein